MYEKSLGSEKKGRSRRVGGKGLWSHLFSAHQHSYHPLLKDIMELEEAARNISQGEARTILNEQQHADYETWKDKLRRDRKWESSRVLEVVAQVNRARDLDLTSKILIIDESFYFFDVIEIAFEQMYEPLVAFRFDENRSPENTQATLEDFQKATAPAVMLLTQSIGDKDLNITAANFVILCGAFWKKSDEEQAWKRAHCRG